MIYAVLNPASLLKFCLKGTTNKIRTVGSAHFLATGFNPLQMIRFLPVADDPILTRSWAVIGDKKIISN